MALAIRPLSSRVQVRYHLGTDEKGKDVYRTRTIGNIKHDAVDQDIFDVINALTDLQSNTVELIRKVEQADLVNE